MTFRLRIRRLPIILILFPFVFLPGCSPGPGSDSGAIDQLENYYFNADLAFAIAYPADWKIATGSGQPPESCSVHWRSAEGESDAPSLLEATVAACPGSYWADGLEAMKAAFLTRRPGFTFSREEEMTLPWGKATRVLGRDQSRAALILFLETGERGYIVTCSTPESEFERYRPLCEKMIVSFQPLQER